MARIPSNFGRAPRPLPFAGHLVSDRVRNFRCRCLPRIKTQAGKTEQRSILIKPQAGGSNVQEHNVSGWYRKSIFAALGDDGSGSNSKDANSINLQLQMCL